jgi:hypothetical protein
MLPLSTYSPISDGLAFIYPLIRLTISESKLPKHLFIFITVSTMFFICKEQVNNKFESLNFRQT